MKIVALFASNERDIGIKPIFEYTISILSELGDNVEIIDIANIAPYDGKNASEIIDIFDKILNADGIIFSFSCFLSSVSSSMKLFLEYFDDQIAKKSIKNKYSMIICKSEIIGERKAAEDVGNILNSLQSADIIRILANNSYNIENKDIKNLIERQSEDFYRIIRQNRKYSFENLYIDSNVKESKIIEAKSINITDLYKNRNISEIEKEESENISQISNLLAKKFSIKDEYLKPALDIKIDLNSSPSHKTAKQLTQSLQHYFNPTLAKDISIYIQLDITGLEAFQGYIFINPDGIDFYEGNFEKSDVYINSSDKVWTDICKKKITAQKAFMTGQIKVRGNFTYLSKFDQLIG